MKLHKWSEIRNRIPADRLAKIDAKVRKDIAYMNSFRGRVVNWFRRLLGV